MIRTVDRDPDYAQYVRMMKRLARYKPCATGLHIAYHDEEANELVTVTNMPRATAAAAREAFAVAALRHADLEADLVCDLMIDGDLIETCEMWRQELEPLQRALA